MKREPGETYWARIEDAFDTVGTGGSPRTFLGQFSKLEPRTANLLAAHWCQSEVCNGGFYQFFRNSTGVLAPEALHAFVAMGIPDWASTLRHAMGFFGAEYPRDRRRRHKALPPPAVGKKREDWDPFCQLDRDFYRWLKPDQNRWSNLADRYAIETAA
jgi:Domain of unknown function (DUF4375)